MPCEKYQDTLIDLAAIGAEPSGDVRAHLGACPSCGSRIEQEKVLLAAIDSGLRQTTNAPLPASLLQHFRARLAHEASENLNVSANWTYGALAAAALLLLMLPALRLHSVPARDRRENPIIQRVRVEPSLVEEVPRMAPSVAISDIPQNSRHFTRHALRPATGDGLDVLVPSEEREAFAKFVLDVKDRKELAAALVNPAPEERNEPLKVEALQITPLDIEPLPGTHMSVISER